MRRCLVIGPGGAGKTTLSEELARRTGLPLVHLDAHFWRPGWRATSTSEWEARVAELTAEREWIMDGNYGGTLDARLEAADAVVFLDTPRWLCLARVLGRWWRFRGRSRPSMPDGCPERLTWEFVTWIWSYGRRRRPGILARLEALGPGIEVHVLRGARHRRAFLEGLGT